MPYMRIILLYCVIDMWWWAGTFFELQDLICRHTPIIWRSSKMEYRWYITGVVFLSSWWCSSCLNFAEFLYLICQRSIYTWYVKQWQNLYSSAKLRTVWRRGGQVQQLLAWTGMRLPWTRMIQLAIACAFEDTFNKTKKCWVVGYIFRESVGNPHFIESCIFLKVLYKLYI